MEAVVKIRISAVRVMRRSMSPKKKSLDLIVNEDILRICLISHQEIQWLPKKPQTSIESNKKRKKKSNLNRIEKSLRKTTISSL
jgi:hypothetical protein